VKTAMAWTKASLKEMPENPYQPPPPREVCAAPQRNIWLWVCLAGLASMLASAWGLCGAADFERGGVTFLNASWALTLAALVCLGSLALIVGSVGCLLAWAARRRRGSV
jgi:hypothetical protein